MKDVAKTGWETKPLGEVCKLLNGRAYKKPELLDSGPYPVLRVGNFFTNNHWYYSDLELDEDKYCDDGDLLYAWSASFGPRIWKGGKVIYHYHIWKVLPSDHVDRDFLYYFFDWDKELIKKEQGAGATMIHVSKGSMEARAIPLPPLEEQQRIVAVLDEAFEGLARARAHAEANLQNARDLFGSALQAALRDESISWNDTSLSDLGAVVTGSTPKTSDKGNLGEHIPFVKPGDFLPDGSLVYDNQGLSEQGAAVSRVLPGGSALMVCIGATIGKAGYSDRPIATNQQINAVVPKDGISGEYLYYQMLTPEFQADVMRGSGQATLPIINKGKWSKLTVRMPSDLSKQAEIVDKLSKIRAQIDAASAQYELQISDLRDLRQSLLQKAFAGELT
ncbi:restriction endonuclease subunit S [Thalassovita sp.]|uniref:restriction endonuclease subunit S n=1 Tax=Thalassovita sp. TaxID=1979401 RepID=UPI002B264F0D|nr:restriction endonuclease subunit S [Thalassovita sp.]